MVDTVDAIKNRLVLSASDLKQLMGWPDAMVEDYLNILNSLIEYAIAINNIGTLVTTPNVRYVDADTVTTDDDAVIVCGNELTVSLHSPISTEPQAPIRIKRVSENGNVTVPTVDAEGYILNVNYQAIDVQWTGSEWISL